MFRNRGELPDIGNGPIDSNNDNNGSGGYSPLHYRYFWNGRLYFIQYDKTFIAIELISILIILLIVFAVYFFAYQLSFEDPIAKVKQTFLNTQIISIVSILIITGLVTFLTKSSKENLIRYLRIITIIYILTITVFLGVKLHLDNKYNTEDTYGNFYDQYESQKNNSDSKRITYGLSGITISNPKEAYIKESFNAYTNFSTKVIVYMIIQFLIVCIIFYLSYRLSKIEDKKQEISKDDQVLFDDKQDVI